MENRDRTQNQGGQGQGGKPKQGGEQKGGANERDRQREGGGQKGGSPTPSGVPNEGRRRESQQGASNDAGREAQSESGYKGGRQGQAGIPNPDDPHDRKSTVSFRGTADVEAKPHDKTRSTT